MDPHSELNQRLANLMRSAQDGNGSAYVRLLREITPLIRRVVQNRRRFLQTADIEDLVQDILLSLHSVRKTYDPGRPFLPWLIVVIRNRLAVSARRYSRREARELQVDDLAVTFSEQEDNSASGVYRDPEALREAIAHLPPAQRQAIEMLKLHEMSLKEAAAQSGTSVGALKVSVHRAMASLKKALKG
jgi:RNA polymerase sigma factor (sigma-70 family)